MSSNFITINNFVKLHLSLFPLSLILRIDLGGEFSQNLVLRTDWCRYKPGKTYTGEDINLRSKTSSVQTRWSSATGIRKPENINFKCFWNFFNFGTYLGATLKWSFYVSFCLPSAHPSDHKKRLLTLLRPTSDANTVGPMLYDVYTLGQNALGQILWPNIRIDPRSDVRRQTGAMSREVFYGRTVCRSEGSRTAKGIVGRRTAVGRKFLLLFRTAPYFVLFRQVFNRYRSFLYWSSKIGQIEGQKICLQTKFEQSGIKKKKHIYTCLWSAKHPNTGQYILVQ